MAGGRIDFARLFQLPPTARELRFYDQLAKQAGFKNHEEAVRHRKSVERYGAAEPVRYEYDVFSPFRRNRGYQPPYPWMRAA